MCCRCIGTKCVKVLGICMIVTAVILIVMGALLIYGGYQVKEEEIIQTFYLEDVGWGIIGLGGFLILVGFIGIIAGWKRWKCMVGVYFFLQLIVAILFIICAVAAVYGRNFVDDKMENREKCRDYDDLKTADDLVLQASEQFCLIACPCDGCGNSDIDNMPDPWTKGTAKAITKCDPCESLSPEMKKYVFDHGGVEYCGDTSQHEKQKNYVDYYFSQQQRHYLDLAEWVEYNFDCSGICTKADLYLFSDVTRGDPHKGCLDRLRDWCKYWLLIGAILGFILGIWLFFLTFASCCICCQRKRFDSILEPDDPMEDQFIDASAK